MTPEVAEALQAGPFHTALRTAIASSGLGLDRIRHRLELRGITVSTTSLSYWQSGRSRPERAESLAAVTALEDLLDLPPGSLRALLGPKRARGPRSIRGRLPRPDAVLGGEAVRELCDMVPASREHTLDILNQQVVVHVDEGFSESLMELTMLVRARRDGVDRYILLYRGDEGCDIDAIDFKPVRDCSVPNVLRHPDAPVALAEIVFDQSLPQGATHLFEVVVQGPGGRSTGHGNAFRYPVDHYSLQVRFSPDALPRRVYRFAQSSLQRDKRETGDLQMGPGHTVALAEAIPRPGALGIGWDRE
jgi:hypothetical protein